MIQIPRQNDVFNKGALSPCRGSLRVDGPPTLNYVPTPIEFGLLFRFDTFSLSLLGGSVQLWWVSGLPKIRDKIRASQRPNMICVLSEIEANAKWNRRLLCDTTLTLESKRRSYSWISFVVIFCFRAQCTPSYILQQAVEVRSACGSSSTRSYVLSPFQLSLSSSCPFHSSLTHSHFHLDKNSHW